MGQEEIIIEEGPLDNPDLSYDENRRLDALMDKAGKSADEAWRIIMNERRGQSQGSTKPPEESPAGAAKQLIAAETRSRFEESATEARVVNQARAEAIDQEQTNRALNALIDTNPNGVHTQVEADEILDESHRAAQRIIGDSPGQQGSGHPSEAA